MPQENRRITAEDLYRFEVVSDVQISPDGAHVLYVVQRVERKKEKKYSNLWLVPASGKEAPAPFTCGDHQDSQPRWSPDGRQIAFLSNRQDEKQAQIHLIPFHGGEARKLTDLQGSFGKLEWSPDGRQLLVAFRKKDQEEIEREADPEKKELGQVARRITRVFYKMDGAGFLPQERWHIWTVDVASGEARQLTDGEYDEEDPTWSPDGQQILFVSNRSPEPDFEPEATELYLMPAAGGEMVQVQTDHVGQKFSPHFSPDGQQIAYLGRRYAGRFWQNTCLYLVPAAGGSARNATAGHDLHLASITINDIGGHPPVTDPIWAHDGQSLFIQVTRQGRQPLLAVSLSGDQPAVTPIVDHQGVVGAASFSRDQRRLAYFRATMSDPGQVFLLDRDSGQNGPLTQHNPWLADVDLGQIEEVRLPASENGGQPAPGLHGWILKPPGFDPQRRYPSIVEVHGGPQTQYGFYFMHEFAFLAAQGYVVAFCNPRGSQGYGEAFAGAIDNNWGTVDYDDVMAWADYVQQLPYIDPERMGITGGSYGGYMTVTVIGRTHRFKAAVAQRVVSNWTSMWGSCDFNWAWTRAMGNETPWENVQNYWRQSPMSTIGGAITPTLLIHSEQDYRCNLEQGEQVFVALKKLGVDSELVLFPGESHGLSRGGRTDRRVARLQHIARWMNKYLQNGAEPEGAAG